MGTERNMLTFRQGWRSFREGLDKRFLWEYWLAVWNHAWEIWWGAGVIGAICAALTLLLRAFKVDIGVGSCVGVPSGWLLCVASRPCPTDTEIFRNDPVSSQ